MGNKNKLTHYERMEKTLESLTPRPETFNSVYRPEEIRADLRMVKAEKSTPDFRRGEERSDAKILEVTFTSMVETGDWFSEADRFSEDEKYEALITFPTSEVDDMFNHIDVIGMIQNEKTGGEVVPFAVDLTYNTTQEKLQKKFSWAHEYGNSVSHDNAAISEFGTAEVKRRANGEEYVRIYPTPSIQKDGLKIPGFASAKYFEDMNDSWHPIHKKGRIPVMPRFVIGYSTDLADVLAKGSPSTEIKEKYGEQEYLRRRRDYLMAEKRAKWCTLMECAEQAKQIAAMVDRLPESMAENMDKKELAEAKKQIAAMKEYFSGALEMAESKAKTNEHEREAMLYAQGDKVRKIISAESEVAYSKWS